MSKQVVSSLAIGLLLVAAAQANTVQLLLFNEPEQGLGSYSGPFVTQDASPEDNDGYLTNLGGDDPFHLGPAYDGGGTIQTSNFAPGAGGGGAPPGPFGAAGGNYLVLNNDFLDLTNPATPGTTPGGDFSVGNGDFTAEFWFRTANEPTHLFGLENGNNPRIRLFMEGGGGAGRILAALHDFNGGPGSEAGPVLTAGTAAGGNPPYNDNEWHHVAIQREGSTLRMIADGGTGSGGETVTVEIPAAFDGLDEPYTATHGLNVSPFSGDISYEDYRFSTRAVPINELGFFSVPGGGVTPPATSFEWNLDGTGDWNSNSHWTPLNGTSLEGPPNSVNHTANLGGAIGANTTVVVDSPVTVNRIVFDNSANTYAIGGTASVSLTVSTVPADPSISVTGNHQFQVEVNLENNTIVDVASDSTLTFNNVLNLDGNTLTKTGDGNLAINNHVTLVGGTIVGAQGTISGFGTVGGDVNNEGGTISPGNSSASVGQIPEPSTVALLLLGMGLLVSGAGVVPAPHPLIPICCYTQAKPTAFGRGRLREIRGSPMAMFRRSGFCILFAAISGFASPSAAADRDVPHLRIGIIGLDTSHVVGFTDILNDPDAKPEVAHCRVVAAYPGGSPDMASSIGRLPKYTEHVKKLGIEVVPSIDELIKRVDCVALLSLDGRPHLKQVLPVLEAGKRVFIDKPFAGSLADAVAIFDAAEKYRTPAFGSSSLRFGKNSQEVRAGSVGKVIHCQTQSPCYIEKTHPDLFWYGIHGVEALFTVMGTGCESVERSTTDDGKIRVEGKWAGGRTGVFQEGSGYSGHAKGEKGEASVGSFDGYRPLVVEIVKFFRTGEVPVEPAETLEIYAFMEAADESKRQGGKEVTLEEMLEKATKKARAPDGLSPD